MNTTSKEYTDGGLHDTSDIVDVSFGVGNVHLGVTNRSVVTVGEVVSLSKALDHIINYNY